MSDPEGKAVVFADVSAETARTLEEASLPLHGDGVAEAENSSDMEKPQASEEIVIEEISIDGMCGVY